MSERVWKPRHLRGEVRGGEPGGGKSVPGLTAGERVDVGGESAAGDAQSSRARRRRSGSASGRSGSRRRGRSGSGTGFRRGLFGQLRQRMGAWGDLFNPLQWPLLAFDLATGWFYSRRWRLVLLPALPLALLTIVPAVGLWGGREPPKRLSERYLQWADQSGASARGPRVSNQLLYRRLLTMELDDQRRYEIAKQLAEAGDVDQARLEMQRLAPDESIGFGAAHLWRAIDLGENSSVENPAPIERVQYHAESALERMPSSVEAMTVLAKLMLVQGQRHRAVTLLERASQLQPNLLLDLTQAYQLNGQLPQALAAAGQAAAHLAERVRDNPRDFEARLGYIQSLLMSDRVDEAETVARETLRLRPEPQSQRAVALCLMQRYERSSGDWQGSKAGHDALLEAWELIDDPSVVVLRGLALEDRQQLLAEHPLAERLRTVQASDELTYPVYLTLADRQLRAGQIGAGRQLLVKALERNPNGLEALNNLAFNLATTEPIDIETAAQLAVRASELAPDNNEVRETAGIIAVQRGQYDLGLRLLEPLLSIFPGRAYLREFLADAYEGIGLSDQALLLREQAEEVRTRLGGGARPAAIAATPQGGDATPPALVEPPADDGLEPQEESSASDSSAGVLQDEAS